jgi:hypothetical protein
MTPVSRLAAVVLLVGAAVTLGWVRISSPGPVALGPAGCASILAALPFCPALPSFEPPQASPKLIADQVSPCEEADAFRPSFCVALPAANKDADRATLVARRQDACAQLSASDAPGFCLVIPSSDTEDATLEREAALLVLRQRLGPDFRRVSGGTLDLWAEAGVSTEVAAQLDAIVREDATAVETYFSRRFRDVPALFVFASQGSFALALEKQFGYSRGMAGQLSNQYGGLLVSGLGAIAINGQNMLGGARPTIFRHELTHVMTHQLAGIGLAMWFDEGLATLVAEADASAFDIDRATAFSILADRGLRMLAFDEDRSWFDRNAALGGNAYGVAAEAVRLMVGKLDRTGLTFLLEAVGRGRSLTSAYTVATGESLAQFVQTIPTNVLAGCTQGISLSGTRPDGLILWRLYGFGAARTVAITADGPGHYAFAVVTDVYGVYTGTLGGPMPSGTYALRATIPSLADVTISVVIGSSTSATRSCVS